MADKLTQEIRMSVVPQNLMGSGIIDQDRITDAAGTAFIAQTRALLENNNVTWVEVFMVPRGQSITPGRAPDWHLTPNFKIDSLTLDYSGSSLIVQVSTHAPQGGERPIQLEEVEIPGVFAVTPEYIASRGGPDAYVASADVEPEVDVDYARIESIVEFQLNQKLTAFRAEFGGDGIREGIEEKVKDGNVELLDPADGRGRVYQDRLFTFVRNAVAGVFYNILRGQDEQGSTWNRDRRNEWKALIREAVTGRASEGEEKQ